MTDSLTGCLYPFKFRHKLIFRTIFKRFFLCQIIHWILLTACLNTYTNLAELVSLLKFIVLLPIWGDQYLCSLICFTGRLTYLYLLNAFNWAMPRLPCNVHILYVTYLIHLVLFNNSERWFAIFFNFLPLSCHLYCKKNCKITAMKADSRC